MTDNGQAETTESTGPKVLHKGVYTLYETPDGGMHIAYRPDGAEADEHLEIPGHMVRLADMAAQGKMSPGQIMKSMAGMFGGGGKG